MPHGQIEPSPHECRVQFTGLRKGITRGRDVAQIVERDAQIVVRQRVERVAAQGMAIRVGCRRHVATLMQRDPILVPVARRVRVLGQQFLVRAERRREVPPDQIEFCQGMPHQTGVRPLRQCALEFTARLVEVAALPEGESQPVACEPVFGAGGCIDHRDAGRTLDGQMRLQRLQRGVECRRLPRCVQRRLVSSQIAQHEAAHQMGVGDARVARNHGIERDERLLVLSALIQHFREVQSRNGVIQRGVHRPFKPALGASEITRMLFDQSPFEQRGAVVRILGDERVQLLRRLALSTDQSQQPRTLTSRLEIVGVRGQHSVEHQQAGVARARLRGRDFQIARRDPHAAIERQRAQEGIDGLDEHPFAEIQDAEVVERAGILRIDAAGHGAQESDVTAVGGSWDGLTHRPCLRPDAARAASPAATPDPGAAGRIRAACTAIR